MLIDFPCKFEVFQTSVQFTVGFNTGDSLLHRAVLPEVNLQGFLFGAFRGICPVTFRGFLHAIHIRMGSPAYPDLLEVAATFMVVQSVDGEYLLPLHLCQAQDCRYFLIPVLELGLSSSIFTSELLMMASFTMGESITSFSSWVTTPAMPWNFLTVL